MKLLVQEFLENKSFHDLEKEHGVYASFSKSGHKFSLNYDQIEAKESDPLAQECRGLILSLEDGSPILATEGSRATVIPGKTKILAFPMKRFFNYGQGSAANIDWSDSKLSILEKLDGTLCIAYWDPFIEKWSIATRSVPEADLLMDNGLFTFRTLFEKAFEDTTGYFFNEAEYLRRGWTYCFELTTPYNRIVVNYPKNRVTLLAVRDLDSLQEMNPRDAMTRHLIPKMPVVQTFEHKSISDLIEWVSSLNPMEYEGVVVRDSGYNRIKVKNALYVAYNRSRDTLGSSIRNCLELILAEKEDDVIPFLPEDIVINLIKIKENVQKFIPYYDNLYKDILSQSTDKKSFAILATKNKDLWSAPLFQMYDGKASGMKDFIQKNRKDGTWSNTFLDKILEISNNI